MAHSKPMHKMPDLRHDPRCKNLQRHFKLQGMVPATIQSYSRAVREAITFFGDRLDLLSRHDISDYFDARLLAKSGSAANSGVCALKLCTRHVVLLKG